MAFFPFEYYNLYSSMSMEDILQRVSKNVKPGKWYNPFVKKDARSYKGSVTKNGFKITRILDYGNACRPVITGRFHPETSVTRIRIRMQMNWIFTVIWLIPLIVLGTFGVFILIPHLTSISAPHPWTSSLPIFGIAAFWYAMATLFFKVESSRSKRFLEKLFEEQPQMTTRE